jgi:hypothetical protein
MCKKRLRGLERQCYSCKADVSLLVNYVENLQEGLARAEAATKSGELGDAVWAYLDVLEVDPDNATARRQVGKVATAVRQFDETAPGRRWLTKLHKQHRWRRWLANAEENGSLTSLIGGAFWFMLVLVALIIGYVMGAASPRPASTGGEQTPTSAAAAPETNTPRASESKPAAQTPKVPPSVKPAKP